MLRKLRYILSAGSYVLNFSDWWNIPRLILFPSSQRTLTLRGTNVRFRVQHFLDAIILNEIFVNSEYELKNLTASNIVDIGANIGAFAIYYAMKFPEARILSFEPAPATYQLLRQNLKLNSIRNVTAINEAVSGDGKEMQLFVGAATGLSGIVAQTRDAKPVKVKSTTLSDILAKFDGPIDLLKMDCEGAEYDTLFNTPKSVMNKIHNMVMEFHEGLTQFNRGDLCTYLADAGFKLKVIPHPLESKIGLIWATR